jgi:beta-lactamase class A
MIPAAMFQYAAAASVVDPRHRSLASKTTAAINSPRGRTALVSLIIALTAAPRALTPTATPFQRSPQVVTGRVWLIFVDDLHLDFKAENGSRRFPRSS